MIKQLLLLLFAQVLCVVPSEIARWSIIGCATALSGERIAKYVWGLTQSNMDRANRHTKAPTMLAFVVGMHVLLGLLLKVYFFAY
jgi:hypothetical protein